MRRASTTLAAALLAGCAVPQPKIPVDSYLGGDLAVVRSYAEQQVLDGAPENLARCSVS